MLATSFSYRLDGLKREKKPKDLWAFCLSIFTLPSSSSLRLLFLFRSGGVGRLQNGEGLDGWAALSLSLSFSWLG